MTTTWRTALLSSRKSGIESYATTLAAYPSITGLTGIIGHIAIAPIKSLGMLELDAALMTDCGLATENGDFLDRSAMIGQQVEDKPWQFTRISQREAPSLALVRTSWDGNALTYTAPGIEPLRIYPDDLRPESREAVHVRITGDDDVHPAVVHRGKIQRWITSLLYQHSNMADHRIRKIDILLMPTVFERRVEDRHRCGTGAQTLYTDGGQMLVTSSSTLAWMNEQIAVETPGFEPILMDAFRPNIVLNGLPPNMEDVIATMNGGPHDMLFGGLSVRCSVTQVDQQTGQSRADKQPLAWLAQHRPARPPENRGATFGVNCVLPLHEGETWILRQGEVFEVIKEK